MVLHHHTSSSMLQQKNIPQLELKKKIYYFIFNGLCEAKATASSRSQRVVLLFLFMIRVNNSTKQREACSLLVCFHGCPSVCPLMLNSHLVELNKYKNKQMRHELYCTVKKKESRRERDRFHLPLNSHLSVSLKHSVIFTLSLCVHPQESPAIHVLSPSIDTDDLKELLQRLILWNHRNCGKFWELSAFLWVSTRCIYLFVSAFFSSYLGWERRGSISLLLLFLPFLDFPNVSD